jgi:hypothetical protein
MPRWRVAAEAAEAAEVAAVTAAVVAAAMAAASAVAMGRIGGGMAAAPWRRHGRLPRRRVQRQQFHGGAGFGAGIGGRTGGFREGGFRGERFGDRDHFRTRGSAASVGATIRLYRLSRLLRRLWRLRLPQPYASQYWYYCQYPAGYYPYVSQCSTNWQPVPAG